MIHLKDKYGAGLHVRTLCMLLPLLDVPLYVELQYVPQTFLMWHQIVLLLSEQQNTGQYSDPVSRKVWIMQGMDCLVQVLFLWRLIMFLEMIPYILYNERLVGLRPKSDYYE